MSDYSDKASANEGHLSMATETAEEWMNELQATYPDKKFVLIGNKADLRNQSENESESDFGLDQATSFISISAKSGEGLDNLKSWMVNQITQGFDMANDTIVSNVRHVEALRLTEEALIKAEEGLYGPITSDFVAMDIRQAMYHLGTITGDISTDDLLGNIFSKFCIGK